MAPKLATKHVLVSEKPWKTVTLKDRTKLEKRVVYELQAPVRWVHYPVRGTKLRTNVRLVKRTWWRSPGKKGSGLEEDLVVFASP